MKISAMNAELLAHAARPSNAVWLISENVSDSVPRVGPV